MQKLTRRGWWQQVSLCPPDILTGICIGICRRTKCLPPPEGGRSWGGTLGAGPPPPLWAGGGGGAVADGQPARPPPPTHHPPRALRQASSGEWWGAPVGAPPPPLALGQVRATAGVMSKSVAPSPPPHSHTYRSVTFDPNMAKVLNVGSEVRTEPNLTEPIRTFLLIRCSE